MVLSMRFHNGIPKGLIADRRAAKLIGVSFNRFKSWQNAGIINPDFTKDASSYYSIEWAKAAKIALDNGIVHPTQHVKFPAVSWMTQQYIKVLATAFDSIQDLEDEPRRHFRLWVVASTVMLQIIAGADKVNPLSNRILNAALSAMDKEEKAIAEEAINIEPLNTMKARIDAVEQKVAE